MAVPSERVILSRPEEVRASNDHIAERAVRLHFVSRVPMLCECGDVRCQSIILIGLGRYEELRTKGFLTAPDHPMEGAEPALREDGFWLQRRADGGERRQPRG
jgi:hypothetical protein